MRIGEKKTKQKKVHLEFWNCQLSIGVIILPFSFYNTDDLSALIWLD